MALRRSRVIEISGIFLLCVLIPYYLIRLDLSHPIPRDGTSLVVGRDFLNSWITGRAAWLANPAGNYHADVYGAALDGVVGPDYPRQLWSYPPTALLLTVPFDRLPYLPALALWLALGFVVFTASLRLWIRDTRLIFAIAASPAAIFGLMSGQYMALGAAAVLTALRLRQDRPWLAGVLIGLLTIKPQLGMMFPVLLLATRNWRALVAATVTTIGLAALTATIWGQEVWTAYLHYGLPSQSAAMIDPDRTMTPFIPTIFSNLRDLGLPGSVALTIQMPCLLLAAAVIWNRFKQKPDTNELESNLLFLAASVLSTPYLVSYDLLALSAMSALMLFRTDQHRMLLLLAFYLPLIQMVAGTYHIPGPALIPAMTALVFLSKEEDRSTRCNTA